MFAGALEIVPEGDCGGVAPVGAGGEEAVRETGGARYEESNIYGIAKVTFHPNNYKRNRILIFLEKGEKSAG